MEDSKDTRKILILINQLKRMLKDIRINADVKFPDTQNVMVENQNELILPETFKIETPEELLSAIKDASASVISEIIKSTSNITNGLKPEKQEKLSSKFDELKSAILEKDDTEILNALSRIEDMIRSSEISVNISSDFEKLINKIDSLDFLNAYTKNGDVKIRINDKQLEDLIKAVRAISVSIGGGSSSSSTSVVNSGSTATLTNVSSSATNTLLISANTARIGLVVMNDSTQILYLKYGSTASSTSFTYKLYPQQTLEMNSTNLYTGLLNGIWASANGAARITEITI